MDSPLRSKSDSSILPRSRKRVRDLVTFYDKIIDDESLDSMLPKPKKVKTRERSDTNRVSNIKNNFERGTLEDAKKQRKEQRKTLKREFSRFNRRVFAASEILATERSYIENLRRLEKHYMIPMSKFLNDKQMKTLFSNFTTVKNLNEDLLGKLEARMTKWDPNTSQVGTVFINMAPFLSMYSDYCCNYTSAMTLASKLKADSPQFNQVLDRAMHDAGTGLDLLDYLIMPVQRIPRYRMLLESLLSLTPPTHPDYDMLAKAVQTVSEKATEINKKMDLVSKQFTVTEIQARFKEGVPHLANLPNISTYDNLQTSALLPEQVDESGMTLVQPWRYFVAEHKFCHVEEDEDRDIVMFLFNDCLLLAQEVKDDSSKKPDLVSLAAYPLWNCFLKRLQDGWTLSKRTPPPFQLVHPTQSWNLVPVSEEGKTKFKSDFESVQTGFLTTYPQYKSKRQAIKLSPNDSRQAWSALLPAPSFAKRISINTHDQETADYTRKELNKLLKENREFFETRPALPLLSQATPTQKTPKKSKLSKLKDDIASVLSPRKTPSSTPNLMLEKSTSALFSSPSSPSRRVSLAASPSYEVKYASPKGSAKKSMSKTNIRSMLEEKENGVNTQADYIRNTIHKLGKQSQELKKSSPSKTELTRVGSAKKLKKRRQVKVESMVI